MDLIIEYLRMLSDEERDRVIEAQEWMTGDVGEPGGPRCMVGHAEMCVALAVKARGFGHRGRYVGSAFDDLCESHTLPLAVRLVKAECARLNGRIPAAPPARETVGAA